MRHRQAQVHPRPRPSPAHPLSRRQRVPRPRGGGNSRYRVPKGASLYGVEMTYCACEMIASGIPCGPPRQPFTLAQEYLLELCMKPDCTERNRTSIAVVAGVIDELRVDADVKWLCKRNIIICFDNFLGTWMGQLPVADEDTKTTGVEEPLMSAADAIDDSGNTNRVVVAAPRVSLDRGARRNRPVDVGEFVWLKAAIRKSALDERGNRF